DSARRELALATATSHRARRGTHSGPRLRSGAGVRSQALRRLRVLRALPPQGGAGTPGRRFRAAARVKEPLLHARKPSDLFHRVRRFPTQVRMNVAHRLVEARRTAPKPNLDPGQI